MLKVSEERARAFRGRPSLAMLAVLLVCTAVASPILAQAPSTISVRGVLRAAGGGPVADGDYLLEFSLWDAEKDGKSAWKEGPVALKVVGGAFGWTLGSKAKLDAKSLAAAAWLQVKVGTEAPLSRATIGAVAWSFHAGSAKDLDCKGCVKSEQLSAAAVGPTHVGFAYAGSVDGIKGGTALKAKVAEGLECSNCVSSGKEISWDGSVDLGAHGLTATKLTSKGDVLAAGTVAAKQFVGDGSKLTGVQSVSGECSKKGEVVKGIKADGTLICAVAMDPAALPADGLDEISNGLLFNQFVDEKSIAKAVPIADNTPKGIESVIDFPDVGIAQKLWITADIVNSDITGVEVQLTDPSGAKYVLKKKGAGKKGDPIKTTWPDATPTVSGDLTTWHGKNPQGKWTLKVVDTLFLDNKVDGALKSWSVKIQTLSSKKVGIKGKLVGGVQLKNADKDPLPCNSENAGYMYFSPKEKLMKVCNGEQYFPVALTVVGSESSPGYSCAHILNLLPASKSGLYFIDPDGPGGVSKLRVYCDMDTLGGGWTLVLHTYYSGNASPGGDYGQNYAAWETKGIGTSDGYKGLKSNTNYFMPLKWWKELSADATELRFQGEHNVNAGTLKDFSMNAKYGLDGSNEAEIKANFCSNNSNCFVLAPGFSTTDKDQDSYGTSCASSYKSGWWYAHCFHYNAHYQAGGVGGHFSGYVKTDPNSKFWTWWVR